MRTSNSETTILRVEIPRGTASVRGGFAPKTYRLDGAEPKNMQDLDICKTGAQTQTTTELLKWVTYTHPGFLNCVNYSHACQDSCLGPRYKLNSKPLRIA